MNHTIIKAIEELRLLTFLYKNVRRTVEPHTYGRTSGSVDGLCAWQTSGGSGAGYRLFLEAEMQDIAANEQRFEGPRTDYKRSDKRFVAIYAEL